jgi:hypothetical protein
MRPLAPSHPVMISRASTWILVATTLGVFLPTGKMMVNVHTQITLHLRALAPSLKLVELRRFPRPELKAALLKREIDHVFMDLPPLKVHVLYLTC